MAGVIKFEETTLEYWDRVYNTILQQRKDKKKEYAQLISAAVAARADIEELEDMLDEMLRLREELN